MSLRIFALVTFLALLPAAVTAQSRGATTGWVDSSETIIVDGMQRRYEMANPPGPRKVRPLVLWLHGGNGNGAQQKRRIEAGGREAMRGLVSVYPTGVAGWNDERSDFITARAQGVDDVAFIGALIDRLVQQGIANRSRVYVFGGSNGGVMAQKLACEAVDRLAGIVIVGAGMDARAAPACRPSRPVPVVHFHGTEDQLMPWAGGRAVPMARRDSGTVLGAEETARFWAGRNGCWSEPARSTRAAKPDQPGMTAQLLDWTRCAGGARVRFYRLNGHGHGWPGLAGAARNDLAGPMSKAVDARLELLRFFDLDQ